MAVNDSNEQSNNTSGRGQQSRQSERAPVTSLSFHSGGLFAAPISTGMGSEYYNRVKAGLVEIYKHSNPNVEIALIDLDNVNEPALVYSAIAVAIREKNHAELGVAYHVLLLEATGEKLTPKYENIRNQQVELLRVTSDAFDAVLAERAYKRVREAFPTAGSWISVDGTVVPADFNPDDKYALHRLALNAGTACATELAMSADDWKDMNLAELSGDNKLVVNIGFNRTQQMDIVGRPMRSDILVNFTSRKTGVDAKNAAVNSGDREARVSEVSSFLDIVRVAAPQNPMYSGYMQQPGYGAQMPPQQKYAARLVITNLASNHSYSTGSVLLALATSLALRDNNNWIQSFRPTPSNNNEVDMADIGALNIDANIKNDSTGFGMRIDTKSDEFKLEHLGQLVGMMIQPGLMVSLDCPEYGPQSWYLSVFAAAANGSPSAYDGIYQAANQLTNGAFGRHFPHGSQMFTDTNNRIHMGYWTDNRGQKRDIRDFDTIAVCNMSGDRNPELIADFTDTYLRTEYPLPQRLHARKRYISGLSNETAVFTGFAQRVTFNAAFMEALSKGIQEVAQNNISVQSPMTGDDFNNQRGVATFVNTALMAPGQTFIGNAGYVPQSYGNYGNQNYGRW